MLVSVIRSGVAPSATCVTATAPKLECWTQITVSATSVNLHTMAMTVHRNAPSNASTEAYSMQRSVNANSAYCLGWALNAMFANLESHWPMAQVAPIQSRVANMALMTQRTADAYVKRVGLASAATSVAVYVRMEHSTQRRVHVLATATGLESIVPPAVLSARMVESWTNVTASASADQCIPGLSAKAAHATYSSRAMHACPSAMVVSGVSKQPSARKSLF